MKQYEQVPAYVLESSWEVCNKVGGIYTVLSTKANTMKSVLGDNILFIGPDLQRESPNPLFIEEPLQWEEWQRMLAAQGLPVRVGRWNIPGEPHVVLVDFQQLFSQRDKFYAEAWAHFGVNSLHGYGDYDEANMFSMAAAKVVESFFHTILNDKSGVVYHAHEWMTCMGALYIQKFVPQIGTLFTTHATSIGRSIAGNGKPLYEYLWAYNGTQMSQELNIEAKHSLERQTAQHIDCFTTVSDVTARECAELLDKTCDAVLVNGFEAGFAPHAAGYASKRKAARKSIFKVANALTGKTFGDDTLVVSTSGRCEVRNKGIDLFVRAMAQCGQSHHTQRQVLALIEVPAWVEGPRADLQARLASKDTFDTPLENPVITHNLHNMYSDQVLGMMRHMGIDNSWSNVTVIFVPCYLDGVDGIFGKSYYDLFPANDLSVYPSYYEPWGYTPLESIAFRVPTVTTSLSGFGRWAERENGGESHLSDGVEVIARNDFNDQEVVDGICRAVEQMLGMSAQECKGIAKRAAALSKKALWEHFFDNYMKAYAIALNKAKARFDFF